MTKFRNNLTGQVQTVASGSRLHLLMQDSDYYEEVSDARKSSGRGSRSRKKSDTSGDDAG